MCDGRFALQPIDAGDSIGRLPLPRQWFGYISIVSEAEIEEGGEAWELATKKSADRDIYGI